MPYCNICGELISKEVSKKYDKMCYECNLDQWNEDEFEDEEDDPDDDFEDEDEP